MPTKYPSSGSARFDAAKRRVVDSGEYLRGYSHFIASVSLMLANHRMSTLRLIDAMERAADYAEEKAAEEENQ